MGVLVDQAKEILRQAEILETQMKDASAIQPTLDAGSPLAYPTWSAHPEIFRTRTTLVDASKAMFQMALGPLDTVRSMIGPSKMEAFVLNVLRHYDIPNLVPRQGSITFTELASKINVQQELLERILRIGFSMNLFQEQPLGSVSHTSLSEAIPALYGWNWLLNRKDFSDAFGSWPASMAVYTEPRRPDIRQLPFNIGNDRDAAFYDVLSAELDGRKNFAEAMRSHTAVSGADTSYLVDCMDWSSLGTGPVVDLGGGSGHISTMLAEKFPNLHFIIQDLQPLEATTNSLIPAHLKSRVSFQVQNFFQPQVQNTGAKVFLLRSVTNDWPDAECVQILKQLVPEVERGAKLLLADRILPPPGRKPTHMESFILFIDVLMFTLFGSKVRSIAQWEAIVHKTDPRLKVTKVYQPEGNEQGVFEVSM